MNRISTWKWGRIFLAVLLLAVAVNGIVQYETNRVYADTTGWIDSAMDAKDSTTISNDLANAKAGLTKWHATSGNAYLALGTPASDMAQVGNNLDTYAKRTAQLSQLNPQSKEYLDGMADLNTSFGSLYLFADDYWLRHQGLGLYLFSEAVNTAAWLSMIAMIGFAFLNRAKHRTAANSI